MQIRFFNKNESVRIVRRLKMSQLSKQLLERRQKNIPQGPFNNSAKENMIFC